MKNQIGLIKSSVLSLTGGCLFAGLFFGPAPARAQSDTTENTFFGAFLVVPIELPHIDTKILDQQLMANGFPAAAYPAVNLGIGLQFFSNRTIFNLSFNKTTAKNEQASQITTVEYRSTAFSVGYSLTQSSRFAIYPFVGFKGSGITYVFKEKVANPSSFANYLQSNLNHKEVTNSRGHLDLGLGVSLHSFYLVNLRFGYLLPIEPIRWQIDNNQTTLTSVPQIRYAYYFSLSLGIGNVASERDYQRRHQGL